MRCPTSTPTIPLMMASAATVFTSPPRFAVAGTASASVRLLAANATAVIVVVSKVSNWVLL